MVQSDVKWQITWPIPTVKTSQLIQIRVVTTLDETKPTVVIPAFYVQGQRRILQPNVIVPSYNILDFNEGSEERRDRG